MPCRRPPTSPREAYFAGAQYPSHSLTRARLVVWLLYALTVTAAAAACDSATAPCGATELLLTTADGGSSLRSVDPDGSCAARRLDLGGPSESVALTPDHARAYAVVRSASDQRFLATIDVASFTELSREPLSSFGVPQTGGSAVTGEAAALSPDGAAIYLWRTSTDGVLGIARFDLSSKQASAFSGPWNLAGLVPLDASPLFPRGALVAVGFRGGTGPRNGQSRVYFLDPLSLEVIDSIMPGAIAGQEDVWQFVPAPDGRTAYIAGSTLLMRYDLGLRALIASTTRQAPGMLVITPDGMRILLTDNGTWPDSPGSGLLRVYDANLALLGDIDVSAPLGGGTHSSTATQTGIAVASADGRRVFVRSGSLERGPLYPPQPARVLSVDIIDRRLMRVTPLGGYGQGFLLLETRQTPP